MARDLKTIYDSLIFEKNLQSSLNNLQPAIDDSQTLLTDLTSTSKVARWRLFLWIVAYGIWLHEQLFDQAKKEIEDLAANVVVGTTRWYAKIALQFQLGYPLLWISDKFQYSQIDPNAQVVKRSAVVESNGQVTIKVAKLSGTQIVPLTTVELSAFETYINQVKIAGTATLVVSRPADLLKLIGTVYYDPQVLDPNGQLINTSVKPVEDTIVSFLANLPFNGELQLSRIVDAIQITQGVKDFVLSSAAAKVGVAAYAPIAVGYSSDAGHMVMDPANPLSSTLTYVADPNV